MADIVIVHRYDRPPAVVWRAVTDPQLVPLWTSTGRGGRSDGFAPVVGVDFRFVGRPVPGWDGIVHCRVLAVDAPRLLRYSWRNKLADRPTEVSYELEPDPGGTRFTYRHNGFGGIGGWIMATLLGRVRRRMLAQGLPRVLADLDSDGHLRPDSTLTARD